MSYLFEQVASVPSIFLVENAECSIHNKFTIILYVLFPTECMGH
jgi:hypothetical protein